MLQWSPLPNEASVPNTYAMQSSLLLLWGIGQRGDRASRETSPHETTPSFCVN